MIPIITLTEPKQVNEEGHIKEINEECSAIEVGEEDSVMEASEEDSVNETNEEGSGNETDDDYSVVETAEECCLGVFDVFRTIREDIYSLIAEAKKPSMVPVDRNGILEKINGLLDKTQQVCDDLDEPYPEEKQSLWARDQLEQLEKAELALGKTHDKILQHGLYDLAWVVREHGIVD